MDSFHNTILTKPKKNIFGAIRGHLPTPSWAYSFPSCMWSRKFEIFRFSGSRYCVGASILPFRRPNMKGTFALLRRRCKVSKLMSISKCTMVRRICSCPFRAYEERRVWFVSGWTQFSSSRHRRVESIPHMHILVSNEGSISSWVRMGRPCLIVQVCGEPKNYGKRANQ